MNSRRVDQFMLLIGALLVAVSSYQLLWGQKNHSESLNILGQLSSLHSVVKTKNALSLDWRDAQVGSDLADNQLIYTDGESSASVTFLSGDGLSIGASSLVRLHSRKDTNIMDVQKGQIRTTLKSDKPLMVEFNGQDYLLTGKDAEVQINLSGNKGEIGVLKGSVQLTNQDTTLELDEKNAIQITGEKIVPTQIYFQILRPASGETIYFAETETSLPFEWTPQEAAEILVARNPEFKNAQTYSAEDILTQKFSTGTYYWQVKNEKGLSLTSSFNLVQEIATEVLRPKDLEEITILATPVSSPLILQWKGEPQETYEVEWSQTEAHRDVVTGTSIILNVKEDGPLKFRVRISNVNRPKAIFSEWRTIQIKTMPFPVMPENLFPLDVEFQTYKAEPEIVEFNWKANSPVEMELETNGKNTETQTLTTNFLKREFKAGVYRWRLRSVDSYKRASAWTEWKTFTIEDLSSNKNNEGVQRIQLKKPDQEVTFAWQSATGSSDTFELARDQKFNDVVIKRDLTTKSTKVQIPKVGTYFWRSRQIQTDGTINVSEPVRVIIEPTPGPIKPLKLPDMEVPLQWKPTKPKTSFLKTIFDFILPSAYAEDFKSSVTLTLPQNEDARGFVLKIFKDETLKELVVERRIYTTNFEWDEAEAGTYYWQYAVIDHWDRVSPFSDASKLFVKGTSAPVIDQPKLISPIRAQEIEPEQLMLRWTSAGEKADYEVDVAQSDSFADLLSHQVTSELQTKPEIKPSTEMYFWRVKAKKGDLEIMSNTGRFILRPKLEKLVVVDQFAPVVPAQRDLKSRAMFLWAPSMDSFEFAKGSQKGKIDGNVLNALEVKGTLFKNVWVYSAEVLRQSGQVFKNQDYLFQRILVDGSYTFYKKAAHTLTVGLSAGQSTGQGYTINGTTVKSQSVSGLSYGPSFHGYHQMSEKWEIQSHARYLLGEIKQIDLGAEAIFHHQNFFSVMGLGMAKRSYELNKGEQSSLKASLGIGKEF